MAGGRERLLACFDALDEARRQTLLEFAEFLRSRESKPAAPAAQELPPPSVEPAPPGESVVAAIRRLSRGYPMLDKAAILNDASALMAQHVMQGRPREEVIGELEALFRDAWRRRVGELEP